MGFDNECILNIQSLPGEYFCPVCRTLIYPNEALQTQCTHLYCKACLAYLVATSPSCPYDGSHVTEADSKPLVEVNKPLAESIGKVAVHCLYHRSGCQWQGTLSDCITHCTNCPSGNSLVVCNRCGAQIFHRLVQEHAPVCPGLQTQGQQVEGSQAQAIAATTQATAQNSSAIASTTSAATVAAALPTTASTTATSSAPSVTAPNATTTAYAPAATPATAGQVQPAAQGTTADQWYQQQMQYQQYYQQYPGYNPYMHYQQAYQQYMQPQMQVAAQQVAQAQMQPSQYMTPQAQVQQTVQAQPQHQVQSQTQAVPQQQQPPPLQPLPQVHQHQQPHMQPQPQAPQMQSLQSQVPPQQPYPIAHAQVSAQPFGQPVPQASHPHPQQLPQAQPHQQPLQAPLHQQTLPHQQNPQLQPPYLQPLPQQQPQAQTQVQPHTQTQPQQQHMQLQPYLQSQAYPQTHPMPHMQPQNSSANSVTGHQSYPQIPGPPQQRPVMHPQQQGIPYQQPQQVAQMCPPQGQFAVQGQQSAMLPPQGPNANPQLAQQQPHHPVGHHTQQVQLQSGIPPQVQQQGLLPLQQAIGSLAGQPYQQGMPPFQQQMQTQPPLRPQGPQFVQQQQQHIPQAQNVAVRPMSHGMPQQQFQHSPSGPVKHLQPGISSQSPMLRSAAHMGAASEPLGGIQMGKGSLAPSSPATQTAKSERVSNAADKPEGSNFNKVQNEGTGSGTLTDEKVNAEAKENEYEVLKDARESSKANAMGLVSDDGNGPNRTTAVTDVIGGATHDRDALHVSDRVQVEKEPKSENPPNMHDAFQRPPGPDRILPHHIQHLGSTQERRFPESAPYRMHAQRSDMILNQIRPEMPPRVPGQPYVQGQSHMPMPQPGSIRPHGEGMMRPSVGRPLTGALDARVSPFDSELMSRQRPPVNALESETNASGFFDARQSESPFVPPSMAKVNGIADDFRPFPPYPGGENINRREIEEDLKQFSRPGNVNVEGLPRPFDRASGRPDVFPDSVPGRPPFSYEIGGPFPTGERHRQPVGVHEDLARRANAAAGRLDLLAPGSEFGRHRMDGMPPFRSPGREFGGVPSNRFGLGNQSHFEDFGGRDRRGFGERPNTLNMPFESAEPMLHDPFTGPDGFFRGLSDGPGSFYKAEQLGSSNLTRSMRNDLDGRDIPHPHFRPDSFGPGSVHAGVWHGGEAHGQGDPAIGGNYSRLGFPNEVGQFGEVSLHGEMDTFGDPRKRNFVSMGWCRICRIDCETVEGLDAHSQTRGHQEMAMDMVLNIKREVAKKQKLNLGGPMSFGVKKVPGKTNYGGRGKKL